MMANNSTIELRKAHSLWKNFYSLHQVLRRIAATLKAGESTYLHTLFHLSIKNKSKK